MGTEPWCTLLGGGAAAPDRAAFFNGALVRYLDYNDAFLAPGETCHPSDMLGALLAAGEHGHARGRDLLTGLAVAYQVQCRLSEAAPLRQRGFDHTVQETYACAAGASRVLNMTAGETAHAVSIAGTALNALRVARTGRLSNWKGLAGPFACAGALEAVFLAKSGVTGPLEVFEGSRGFMESMSGPFSLDWRKEGLEIVGRTLMKKYNAEIHSQSAVEALLQIRSSAGFGARDVDRIEVDIFDVAYDIIGGGEEGPKRDVHTKEEADHSLPYILAVALLDGTVSPAQYAPARIASPDVHALMRRIRIHPDPAFSLAFPDAMPCRVTAVLLDGRRFEVVKKDYEGFPTRPLPDRAVRDKFGALGRDRLDRLQMDSIAGCVDELERLPVRALIHELEGVRLPARRPA